jgi:putative ABC transport system ATP-binding protein
MITLRRITRTYRTDDVETTALDAIDLDIARGEFVAVMGPSGCGKSTLLNVLGLLDAPSSGSLRFLDRELAGRSEAALAEVRKRHVGFVFQSFNLIDDLTVEANVALPLLYRGVSARDRRRRVAEAMDAVAIGHRAGHLPSQLSGGQQQRAAIARAIVTRPDLLLADEPTGNLDSQNGAEVMAMLTRLNADGTTIVMVTHAVHDADHAGRVVQLLDGRIVAGSRHAPAVRAC